MAIELRGCVVDLDGRRVVRGDVAQELTAAEGKLLEALVEHRGQDVSADDLCQAIWQRDAPPDAMALRQLVVRLRRKVEVDPKRPKDLLTVRGKGYRLAALPRAPVPMERRPIVDLGRGLQVDLSGLEAIKDGQAIALTSQEAKILAALISAGGAFVPRDELYRAAWGHTGPLDTRALDSAVHRLRTKIESNPEAPERIVTQRGMGARLASSSDRGNVPASADVFVGRCREVEEVREALQRSRLVTLTGPAGVGKTRLALHVALGWTGLAWFVDLSDARSESDVRASLAVTLGVDGAGIVDALRARAVTLLVLDNTEQTDEAARNVLGGLLGALPALTVLATSRERLRLRGEHAIGTPPLDPDASAELFRIRRLARVPDWKPDASEHALVAEICARVDHLPLAIELACGRGPFLDLASLKAGVAEPLTFLVGGPLDAGRHHHTLRAAIATSWGLLDPDEQAAFRTLAALEGTFAIDDARALLAPGADVALLLERLVDRSLVQIAPTGRFRMLEAIRAFGIEQLEACGEERAVRDRHAERYAGLSATVDDETPLDAIDRTNVLAAARQAVRTENAALASRLLWPVGRVTRARGPMEVTIAVCDLVLAGDLGPAKNADALLLRSRAFHELGRNAESRADTEEALTLSRALGDPMREVQLTMQLGGLWTALGDAQKGLSLLRTAADRRSVLKPIHRAVLEGNLGISLSITGELEEAAVWIERARASHLAGGRAHLATGMVTHLGWLAFQQGDANRAESLLRQALAEHSAVGQARWVAIDARFLAHVLAEGGRIEEARDVLSTGMAGDGAIDVGLTVATLADLLRRSGDLSAARAKIMPILAQHRASGPGLALAEMLVVLAEIEIDAGATEVAERALEEATQLVSDQLGPRAYLTRRVLAARTRLERCARGP